MINKIEIAVNDKMFVYEIGRFGVVDIDITGGIPLISQEIDGVKEELVFKDFPYFTSRVIPNV